MRKYILILISIVLAIICFCLMFFGIKIWKFKIVYSYNDVVEISSEKNQLLADLNYKNTTEFEEKKEALEKASSEYKTKKSEYNKLVKNGLIIESGLDASNISDMDSLWSIIKNYAIENDVVVQFDVSKSVSATSISSNYVMCDLNFAVSGEYIAITDFIYSIEGDDKLDFEISDFVMSKDDENLQATFTVKGVPLNSESL